MRPQEAGELGGGPLGPPMGAAQASQGGGGGPGEEDSGAQPTPRLGAEGSGSRSWSMVGSGDDSTCVHVKVMPLLPSKAERDVETFKVTTAGAVLQGGMPAEVRDVAKEYEKTSGQTLTRIFVDDRRAQQLLISYVAGNYYVVPAPELFSRHTGACRVLGDKNQRSVEYELQVGDFLRIGSVGVVVSEVHTGVGEAKVIAESDLLYLREDVGAIKEDLFATEEAATAADEVALRLSPGRSPRHPQCYMCFDDEDTEDNPLVAPCLCKGGTRYVHLVCLQRWQSSASEDRVVVTSSADEKHTCKVCKSRYKTHVRTKDGRMLPLMVHQLPPPYICFLVVTRHETAEDLFNTQFQLSFLEKKQILIGRSRNCDMVLDYRTVSTQHASVTFKRGAFVFRDLNSSNGSMLNLRRPLRLPFGHWVRVRYGRSIVALKAKRNWLLRRFSSVGQVGGSKRELLETSKSLSDSGSSSGGGAGARGAAAGGGGGAEEQLDFLNTLCHITYTPRMRVAAGYDRFESMSPSGPQPPPQQRSSFQLQQMHTMASSMRFAAALGGSSGSDLDDSAGAAGRRKPPEQREGASSNAVLRDAAFGLHPIVRGQSQRAAPFIPPPSPIEESQLSQLST